MHPDNFMVLLHFGYWDKDKEKGEENRGERCV